MTQPTEPIRDRLTQEAILAGLAVHAIELEKTAKDLRESYRFSRWLKATLGIGVLLFAGLIAIALLNLSNGHAIRSCTTPGGACYERGQTQTGKAVALIVAQVNAHTDLVFIATMECSRPHRSAAGFERCMRAHGLTAP